MLGSSRVAKAQFQPVEQEATEIPNNLPPPKTSFVGREQELRLIAEQLADPNCRLLTLHGMGGIGKSRLAMQAAYEQREQGNFKDGVFFVGLDALSSADLIPSSIAEAVGFEGRRQEDRLAQLEQFIGKKDILLIMDNFEHLMEGATLLAKLLTAHPHLKLLVTSRERLNLQEEWVLPVEGLTFPLNENGVKASSAIQLFVQRAKRANLGFVVTQENVEAIRSICYLVEGSPLGIEIAAVWVKAMTPAEIAQEIETSVDLLVSSTRNIIERHQSVRVAFEHSWRLLTAKEREVLRKLSVFKGGFGREAAAEVAEATLPVLASLVDKSLLRVSGEGRYDQHTLLSKYAREKLSEDSAEELESFEKHREYYLQFAEQKAQEMNDETKLETLKQIDSEIGNLRWLWTIAKDEKDLLKLIWVIHPYQQWRGLWHEAITWVERCLSVAISEKQYGAFARLLAYLGKTHRTLKDYTKAIEYFTQSLGVYKNIHSRDGLVEIHIDTAWTYYLLNELDSAYQNFIAARELADPLQDALHLATVDHGLGMIEAEKKNLERARSLLEQSYQTIQHLDGGPLRETRVAVDLAIIHGLLGDSEKEIKLYKDILKTLARVDNKLTEMIVLNNLAEAYSLIENQEEALETFEHLKRTARAVGHSRMRIRADAGIVEILLAQGAFDKALKLAQGLSDTLDQIGSGTERGIITRILGEISLALDDRDTAQRWFVQSISHLKGVLNQEEFLKAQRGLELATSDVG